MRVTAYNLQWLLQLAERKPLAMISEEYAAERRELLRHEPYRAEEEWPHRVA